ncbi:MAG: hypothetical protein ACJAUP_001320 [Cellvibrionaceae bacterium]
MGIKNFVKGTQFSNRGFSTLDQLAKAQFSEHIQDRGKFPSKPHSHNCCGPARAVRDLWLKFEQSTNEYTDAAQALLKAASTSLKRQGPRQLAGENRWLKIISRYKKEDSSLPSLEDRRLPYGTSVLSAKKTNCYGYAVNKAKASDQKNLGHDLHPGELAGREYWDHDAPALEPDREKYLELDLPARSATIKNVLTKALKDGLRLEPIPGGYPVYFSLAPDDYHWYRQDDTGYWSHKPGPNDVRNKDGDGNLSDNLITNPINANRKHGYTNYDKGGCFLWVPPDLGADSDLNVYEPRPRPAR